MTPFDRILREARRKSVWQTFAIYVAASWVVLQVVDTLAGALDLPSWAPRLALFLLIIGLPIVIATAVVQARVGAGPANPAGGATEGGRPDRGGADVPGPDASGPTGAVEWLTRRNALIGGVLAMALWGVVAAGWVLLGSGPGSNSPLAGSGTPSVAVLPFENRSAERGSEFFVDGVHDDILTQLSKIGGMRVISRSSVSQYRGSDKTVPEIATELGVSALLEGGVQRSGNSVRVNVQLIDGATDDHLWAETFDRELTAENLFAIQSEIAVRVAQQLQVQLTNAERDRIETVPTTSREAYDAYLRGTDQLRRTASEASTRAALSHLERAIDLDSEFAIAHAALSTAHTSMYWYWWDRSAERLQIGREAAERALALDPDLPEGRFALGLYHYRGSLDYARAMVEFAEARSGRPGDGSILAAVGNAQRRMGDFEGSLATYAEASELDPRNAGTVLQIGVSNTWLRRWDDAIAAFEKAIELEPAGTVAYVMKARALVGAGRLEEARTFAQASAVLVGPAAILERNTSGAEAVLRTLYPDPGPALERLRRERDRVPPALYHVVSAELLARMGDAAAARAGYDSARAALEATRSDRPGDWRWSSERAVALAGLGEAGPAVEEATASGQLMSPDVDALDAADPPVFLAQVLVMLGEHERALDALDEALSRPGWITGAWLEADPVWAPLRGEPRFAGLVGR